MKTAKNNMTRDELLKTHDTLCRRAQELMKIKNHDYAKDTDVFRNFRRYGSQGILVRMSDKQARLDSFEENGEFQVVDEKLLDTILDLINYAVIYYAYKFEEKGDPGQVAPNGDAVIVKDGPYCSFSLCDELAAFHNEKTGRYYCTRCKEESIYKDEAFTAMGGL